MIRWTFVFEEGNVRSDVKEDAEDARIAEFIAASPSGLLMMPGETTTLFINLSRVKCIGRSIVDEEAEKLAAAQAEAAALVAAQPAEVIPA